MITSKISTGIRGTAPHTSFARSGTEWEAAAWANLLDDWLGPEHDIYSRLPQSSTPDDQRAKISS